MEPWDNWEAAYNPTSQSLQVKALDLSPRYQLSLICHKKRKKKAPKASKSLHLVPTIPQQSWTRCKETHQRFQLFTAATRYTDLKRRRPEKLSRTKCEGFELMGARALIRRERSGRRERRRMRDLLVSLFNRWPAISGYPGDVSRLSEWTRFGTEGARRRRRRWWGVDSDSCCTRWVCWWCLTAWLRHRWMDGRDLVFWCTWTWNVMATGHLSSSDSILSRDK